MRESTFLVILYLVAWTHGESRLDWGQAMRLINAPMLSMVMWKGPADVTAALQAVDLPASLHALNAARENIKRVISGALCVESALSQIIADYFFGPSHENEKKYVFRSKVLASDW